MDKLPRNMKRNILFGSTLLTATVGVAQLSPHVEAPLFRHLMEVNKEWRTMCPAPANADHMVHFTNEAERIAQHLHLVAEQLRSTAPQALSAAQLKERNRLLTRLDAYADRGLFPQNHVLPYRNPVFIDPNNTACAVGQLMIESGHRQLAERIREEMNVAYVHDMKRADVFAWAGASGFSEDELAWIQPAYTPSIPWFAMGGGTNGEVKELLRLSNGDMLVAGIFTQAGTTTANYVARYNGSTYTALPGFPLGDIHTAIEFNGSIYVGGSFNGGSSDLAMWNGSTWTLQAAFSSKYAEVFDLHIQDGMLYAAGASSGFAGVSYEVKKYMNNTWQFVGQSLNGTIRTLDTFNGTLVCGGDFTGNIFTQDSTLLHVAQLNINTWQQLGDGLNGRVFDLLVSNDSLYAGGDCVGEVATYFGMARIAPGAAIWEPMMPNIANYIFSPQDGLTHINALFAHNGRMYFGGEFLISNFLEYGNSMGVIDGPDNVAPMADMNGPVNDLDLFGSDQLVAGGAFSTNTGANLPFVATTDLATGIPQRDKPAMQLRVWPDPATELITVDAGVALSSSARIEVRDVKGALVMSAAGGGSVTHIDVHGLASGTYTLRVTHDAMIRTATFVRQ
jgi:hypothetical protein